MTTVMNEKVEPLLADVLEAHGGAAAWEEVDHLVVRLSLGGPFWGARGWPGLLQGLTATVGTRRQRLVFAPWTAPGRVGVLETGPERVTLRTTAGEIVEQRADPRAGFPLPFDPPATPWDVLEVFYFPAYACWNYLTAPFLLTWPGVEAREIEPWQEDGETWRRLAVTFPPSIATHNPTQTFYYGADDLLLRRLDYSPDVTGHPPIAHYTYDNKTFGGLVFPTRRRVHVHDPEGHADTAQAAITIDVEHVEVVRG